MPATGATSRVPGATLTENWMVFVERFKVDWIFTGTFRDAVHPEPADKIWRRFTNDLNCGPYARLRVMRPRISQRLSWHNLARPACRLAAQCYASVEPWPNTARPLFNQTHDLNGRDSHVDTCKI